MQIINNIANLPRRIDSLLLGETFTMSRETNERYMRCDRLSIKSNIQYVNLETGMISEMNKDTTVYPVEVVAVDRMILDSLKK
jgi:hypothetical protein